ncbi:MAG: S8 family serine peptidase, partial [Clostridia bacterium]|nr:S8 family serine peptidase [Clostridia bacterium]
EAETYYTEGADEYSAALRAAYGSSDMRGFSIASEDAALYKNTSRTLLVYCEGDLEDAAALHDICDEYHIHTLIYADSNEADDAYRFYTENGYDVCRDDVLETCDTYLSWGPEYIGTPLFTQGLTASYGSVFNMPEVKVAVIDSGVDYAHSFLSGRVDTTNDRDFYNGDYDAMDDNNHGTHVAGIIADNTFSNVTLLPIKVTNSNGSLTTTTLKSGIQYAIEKNVDVINLSLGATSEDHARSSKTIFSNVFSTANNRGITICAAAGNATYGITHNANYIFPAYMDHTIVVANLTQDGSISNSSNYGTVIDISAPGAGIRSTIRNNKYANMSGTSMACPFASAAAALLITRNPYIAPDGIENELRANASPYPPQYDDEYYGLYGTGILNLSNYYIDDDPSATATPKPTARPTAPPTAAPTNTPKPGISKLILDITYDEHGVIYAVIENKDNVLSHSAEAIAVGYKNGVPKTIERMSVVTEGEEAVFNKYMPNADSFEYIKLFVWDDLNGMKPLSLSETVNVVKTGDGKYIVQSIKE